MNSFFASLVLLFAFQAGGQDSFERRIGFVPGSFDPPTLAHLRMFRMTLEEFRVDQLVIMVNTIAGPKDFEASFLQRKAMIEAALPEYASRIRIVREPRQGARALVHELSSNPRHALVAVIGEDAFHGTDEVRPNIYYKVLSRPGLEKPLPAVPQVERISIPEMDGISSSRVRSAIASGAIDRLDSLLDARTKTLILNQGLYARPPPALEEVRRRQYHQAYQNFKSGISASNPNLVDRLPERPPFRATQSPGEWQDKFLRLVWTWEDFPAIEAYFSFRSCLGEIP